MRVGLYFGTFNPIHIGHLIIANHMAQHPDLDQVWIVVSPQNPLKEKNTLLSDYHRLNLVRVAIEDNFNLRASDVEFSLPKPSYTVTTLAHLKEKYPTYEFSLILGEDNLRNFHKWYNYEYMLEHHHLYVYPRNLNADELASITSEDKDQYAVLRAHSHVHFCEDTPLMKISSSFIRDAIKRGKDVRYLLSEPVFKYVDEMNFYKK